MAGRECTQETFLKTINILGISFGDSIGTRECIKRHIQPSMFHLILEDISTIPLL